MKDTTADELVAAVLKAVVDRTGIPPEVIMNPMCDLDDGVRSGCGGYCVWERAGFIFPTSK